MSRPRRDSWWKREREREAAPVPDSDDHDAVPPVDDLAQTRDWRPPRAQTKPAPEPADALEVLTKTVSRLKLAIGVLVVPVIVSGKMAFTMISERVEANTLAKIERARLLEDIAAMKEDARAQARALADQARVIRNAEEALRLHAVRIEDFLQDRRRTGTP